MKIKKNIIKLTNICLSLFLALFGFSNCDDVRVEYGVPNADYTVKGKVTDKSDSKPIKGIRIGYSFYQDIRLMYGVIPTEYRAYNADTTETNGSFSLTDHFSIGEIKGDTIPVYIQDIDGEENGLYRDTIINVDFENATRSEKSGNWYDGELTVEKNIELKRKTNE